MNQDQAYLLTTIVRPLLEAGFVQWDVSDIIFNGSLRWRGIEGELGRRVVLAILVVGLGIVLAVAAHLAIRVAERRARKVYEELVGEEVAVNPLDDVWEDVRPLAGRWGCLVTALEFVRGVGVVVALGAGLYLLTGQ